jgi:tetraacyldisaccharide 4'-kinase
MIILAPLGWLYGRLIQLRNALYDRGIFKSHDLGVNTISVGNITTGGTGKTPLVAYISRVLAKRGEKVCILTRGYGRNHPKQKVLVSDAANIYADVREAGDEAFELARSLLGKAAVIADADRVSGAEWARRDLSPTVFVLDDGFQHRIAKRDTDIVCIDATNPFGGGMLPSGQLREPRSCLTRANMFVITRSELVDTDRLSTLRAELGRLNPRAAVFQTSTVIEKIVRLAEFQAEMTVVREVCRALAFCGLGNPQSFFSRMKLEGIELIGEESFPDHHYYTQRDAAHLDRLGAKLGAECLITTAKDAVKLDGLKFTLPCFVVEIELVMDNPTRFAELI